MASNSGYRVNEDGSVTKINSSGGGNNSGGSSDNSGCIWFVVIAIIIGIVIAVADSNSDSSNGNYEDTVVVVEEAVEEAPVAEVVEAPSTTYLRVSDDDIVMNSSGGSADITVYTDCDWSIDVGVAAWGHLTKYSDSVVLRLDENSSRSTRTDYFIIKSGSYTKRVNITQYGNTSPSAEIENIWMDHNVYENGQQGMRIHVKFTVDNMNGKNIYAYAFFYWGDNTTPLHNRYGDNLSFYGYGTSNYDGCRFEDMKIFVPYTEMNMQSGQGSVSLSFDIAIRDGAGNQLARKNNTQITFSN